MFMCIIFLTIFILFLQLLIDIIFNTVVPLPIPATSPNRAKTASMTVDDTINEAVSHAIHDTSIAVANSAEEMAKVFEANIVSSFTAEELGEAVQDILDVRNNTI